MSRHTLSVLVEDKPGVLARVASLFSRRGFNIESLAVGPTELPDVSRMTIVVTVDLLPLEQVTKQLNKLIPVIKIAEIEAGNGVERELMLVTVKAASEFRSQVTELAAIFDAKIIDVGFDTLTLMLAGAPSAIEALLDLLKPFGVVEAQRTGRVALPKLVRKAPAKLRAVKKGA